METCSDRPEHDPGSRREWSQALWWGGQTEAQYLRAFRDCLSQPHHFDPKSKEIAKATWHIGAESRSEPGTSAPHPEFLYCLGPGANHCDHSHTLALSLGSLRSHVPESQEHMLSPLHGKGNQGFERDEPCPRAGDKVRAEPGTQQALLASNPTCYMCTCPRYLLCARCFICAISSLCCPCKVIISLVHR